MTAIYYDTLKNAVRIHCFWCTGHKKLHNSGYTSVLLFVSYIAMMPSSSRPGPGPIDRCWIDTDQNDGAFTFQVLLNHKFFLVILAFTSSFLRQTKQLPSPGTRVISQLQQTRSMSLAVKITEKDPEIRSFPTSVQPQELVFWEFKYPLLKILPCNLRCQDIYPIFLYTCMWRCHSLSSFTEKYTNTCAANKGN